MWTGPPAAPPLALDQTGHDADGGQIGGAPTADGEPEEDRTVPVALLLVAEAEPGGDQQVVDGAIGTGVTGGPCPHRAVDEPGVPLGQGGVGETEPARLGRPEAVDEDVRPGQQTVQVPVSLPGREVEDHAPLGPVPGEEGGGVAGRVPVRTLHLHDLGAGLGQQQGGHRSGDPLRAVDHPDPVQDAGRPGRASGPASVTGRWCSTHRVPLGSLRGAGSVVPDAVSRSHRGPVPGRPVPPGPRRTDVLP